MNIKTCVEKQTIRLKGCFPKGTAFALIALDPDEKPIHVITGTNINRASLNFVLRECLRIADEAIEKKNQIEDGDNGQKGKHGSN